MKSGAVIVFVVLVAAVSCYPDKTDLKQVKEENARKKACMRDCTKVEFMPICAGKMGQKPVTFGSECVLSNFNCEHQEVSMSRIKLGVCPGSDGIRLY